MSTDQETPRPPETPEFGFVTPGGPTHEYPPDGDFAVRKLSFGPYDNNVYVVSSAGEAFIIDAAAPPERLEPEIGGARVVGIAITHGHPDHTVYVEQLHEAFGAPPVYVHQPGWRGEVKEVTDEEIIRIGGIEARVIYAPGHTPDSMCLVVGRFLFSGDALFPGGPGNTNGDAARFRRAMDSLDRLFALPDDTRVCPGHGLDTTVARERPYADVWRARGW